MTDLDDEEESRPGAVAMQVRCVHCLREQYCMNVPAISTGELACPYCGAFSTPMGMRDYYEALKAERARRAAAG